MQLELETMSDKEMRHRLRNLEQMNEFLTRYLVDVSSGLEAGIADDGAVRDPVMLVAARRRASRITQRLAVVA